MLWWGLISTAALTLVGNSVVVSAEQQQQKPPMTVEEKDLAVKAGNPTTTPSLLPGTQTITTRVVGGQTVTKPSKYPFFVEWEDAKCGASLIWGGTYSSQ